VKYTVSLLLASICNYLITRLMFFKVLFMFVFLIRVLFSTSCILYFCIVMCIVSPSVYSCVFHIFAQVH